jgi:hypothetical protein
MRARFPKALTGFFAAGLVALVVAGCGGGSSSSSTTNSSTSSASAPASSATTTSTTSASGPVPGIPQGPNAGDKDSDNNGGPSDGDGPI